MWECILLVVEVQLINQFSIELIESNLGCFSVYLVLTKTPHQWHLLNSGGRAITVYVE